MPFDSPDSVNDRTFVQERVLFDLPITTLDGDNLHVEASPQQVLSHALETALLAKQSDDNNKEDKQYTKALQSYGTSLEALKQALTKVQSLADDRILVAMLVLDQFEVRVDTLARANTLMMAYRHLSCKDSRGMVHTTTL
jgi:parvulin-like peptidyl-prolyl isomerase